MRALLAGLLLAGLGLPALAQGTGLPGGASSLTERHGAWSVNCRLVEGVKDCAFSQGAANPQTGQTLAALELGAPAANKAEGMLLTAFGLRLDAGVQLLIDGQKLGPAHPFLACIEAGCLVPLAFDEVGLSALKVGTELQIVVVNMRSGEEVTVPLSLQGFTAAYNRTAELAK
jgi:invasion protein IalB